MCNAKQHSNKKNIFSLFRTLFYVACALLFSLYALNSHALVLEHLHQQNILQTTFAHKKIGYYVGSFDPLHLGHEAFVHEIIQKNVCDYVIVYPCWGGDSFKQRTDVQLRLEMLCAAFANHAKIIVTKLTPLELQKLLTVADAQDKVKPAFLGTEFIGIMGSDSVIAMHAYSSAEWAVNFMRGVKIPSHYAQHTNGSTMALPVHSFIVALCKKDEESMFTRFVDDRPIIHVLENIETKELSSSDIKIALKENKGIAGMISLPILHLIQKYNMYQ